MLRTPAVPPLTPAQCLSRAQGDAPPLIRRLAALLYEGVLLFGVSMATALAYGVATQQRHALAGRSGLMAVMFLMLALYFIWFWVRGGQTLAMKTWHVRVLGQNGQPLGLMQAAKRYLLSWLWFLPPLGLAWAAQWHSTREIGSLLGVWIVIYAGMTRLLPRQQSLHDLICGTCIIDTRP